jgi:predicted metal-dependent phosphoesterase TrpH
LWDADRVKDLADNSGVVIFRGIEASTDQGHLLVFGLKDYPQDFGCAEKLREAADEMGAVIVVAHPYRHTPRWVTWKKVGKRPAFRLAHEVEIYNGISSEMDNELASQLCTRLGFRGVGGSDAHSFSQVGLGVTIFDNTINSDDELVEALKAKAFSAGRLVAGDFLPVDSYCITSNPV